MLYETFRVYGKMLEIKIKKEYYEQQSAIIEFADSISVNYIQLEQKEFKINNHILKVSLHDYQNQDEFRTANVFVNNIPSDISQEQLSIFFEQFGPVFNCKIKKQNYLNQKPQLYLIPQEQFWFCEVQESLDYYRFDGSLLKVAIKNKWKNSNHLTFQRQILTKSANINDNLRILQKIELGRILINMGIINSRLFQFQKITNENCFVKMQNDQPYIILVFPTLSDTIKFMKLANLFKWHPCFNKILIVFQQYIKIILLIYLILKHFNNFINNIK
ncbi:unnamed protein product [Paramecium pentaurelia]|uniref:RRM domain-containing protein n=1 Tax=Paramecium pentaurelia TaxID=43138 RepID=A0A8S1YAP6_9CILI|nr:unnamed protein product [Paramecium pentaurelia]